MAKITITVDDSPEMRNALAFLAVMHCSDEAEHWDAERARRVRMGSPKKLAAAYRAIATAIGAVLPLEW